MSCTVFPVANPYPDVRRRYWNAYMLFYQRISEQNSPVLPKKSRVSVMRQEAEDLSLWVTQLNANKSHANGFSEADIFFLSGLHLPLQTFPLSHPHDPPEPIMTGSLCSPGWSGKERKRACLWRRCLPGSFRSHYLTSHVILSNSEKESPAPSV